MPVGVVVPVGDVVALGEVVVVVVAADTKLLMNVVEQVTALPPPVEASLHWLIFTGSAEEAPVTVQFTANCPA